MHKKPWRLATVGSTAVLALLAGCGDDTDNTAAEQSAQNADSGAMQTDAQLPPTDADAMQAWLASGAYKSWECEAKATKKTQGAPAIHAHGGTNRVCSNALLASSSAENGAFPKGVASVKELYNDAGTMTGAAVALKVQAESADGKGWYYWEGKKNSGMGIPGCAGCHSAAGSDADHPGAGDYVYFQVHAP